MLSAGLKLFRITVLGTLLFWGNAASAGDKPTRTPINGPIMPSAVVESGPKVVYGTDDRIDVYEETDSDRLTWAASTCGLFFNSSVQDNGNGTYTIRTSDYDVCPEEPFANQPKAAFCSGFLVGEDIVATAGHCYDAGDYNGVWFIFGFTMEDANTPVLTVSEDRVYRGVQVLSQSPDGALDHAVVRVDRPVTSPGAVPFAVRRDGEISVGANVGVIGHPAGIPLKLAFGDDTVVRANSNPGYFVANLDTYGGNSGSPVIDPATGIIEGILVRGETDFVQVGNCLRSNVLSNTGGRGEDVTKIINFIEDIPELISGDGRLTLDREAYACSGVMEIELRDLDLAGADTAAISVMTSGGDMETVLLAETEMAGVFEAMLAIGAGTAVPDNGMLEVAEGHTVTAAYSDAAHGPDAPDVVSAMVVVDCTPPEIMDVSVSLIGAQYATIQFESSEPALGTLRAGGVCGDADAQAMFTLDTSHSVVLQGLLPLTDYYISIEAVDAAGNATTENNGGQCFHFATAATTEYYTEVFSNQLPDLSGSALTFTPQSSGGYAMCRDFISSLPVSVSGATPLLLADDDFRQVGLEGSAQFPFYGSLYDNIYVNSNGNVTFGSGDSSAAFDIDTHFNTPRVSPCLIDLDPDAGGSVWYRQLGDRIAVTWQSVPHFWYGGSNTIQLELFFDGTIRFSYLSITGFPSVVGLSAGLGVLSDFQSIDLSAQASCDVEVERYHSADTNSDFIIGLQELLRLIQFFNFGAYHCDASGEDGFAPGAGSQTCSPHDLDYNSQNWSVSMSELLRLVQIYNSSGYVYDPAQGTEDGFVPIAVK